MSIFDKIRDCLIREGYAEDPQLDTRLADLDADSIERAYLLLELEEAIGKQIPDDDFQKLCTVQDVVNYAERA